MKLCECGCGNPVTDYKYRPRRFMPGHNSRGKNNPNYKNGRVIDKSGYVLIHKPDHPRSTGRGYIREHILIAEKALGKPLPKAAVVHDINSRNSDNKRINLVICNDSGYHNLLHQRERALNACLNPNWLRCHFCKQWDSPANMYVYPNKNVGVHRSCSAKDRRQRYRAALIAKGEE